MDYKRIIIIIIMNRVRLLNFYLWIMDKIHHDIIIEK